jgi:CDP-glucose 4,6-dehydratase
VIEALSGRTVLVTGHTGFKGSWLALYLHSLGARVFGASLDPPTNPSHFERARIGGLLAGDARGDLRELAFAEKVVAESKPEVIFHLAAQPLVRESYRDPSATFATNVLGTVHVLEAVRRRNKPCVVVVATSDKCYEEADLGRGYREDDRLGGRDPYSASKAAAEIVTASYRASFFGGEVKVATARAGNVIGGGDWATDRLVCDAVRALAAGAPIVVRNPSSTRPFQHVLDPLHGYLLLASYMLRGEGYDSAWNFAANESLAAGELVDRIIAAWGAGERVDRVDPNAPHEAPRLALDASRARERLGFRPRLSIDATVERTVAWYRRFYRGEDARALSLEDLSHFAALR